ncbi:MAG TPA: beta-propeller domain-containing protein, partial [Acidimicrobiales bacterium]|nr:beta-propeller domain-containing protein [Acidimicrobiales bacterium]
MNARRGSILPRTLVALLLVASAGACTGADRAQGPTEPGDDEEPRLQLIGALQSFEACDELLDYLHREGARLGPYGIGGGVANFHRRMAATVDQMGPTAAESGDAAGAAPPSPAAPKAGEDFSGTNVQEAGVDEPDLVKTDGRRLVTMANGALKVVDVSADAPRVLSSLPVGQPGYGEAQLFLTGDRVVVLHQAQQFVLDTPQPAPTPRSAELAGPPVVPYRQQARVTVVDIADPAAPRVASELTLDGSLVASRMVDGVARLVLRSDSPRIGFVYPNNREGVALAEDANRRAIEGSSLDDWLPGYTYSEPGRPDATASGRVGDCRDVARPAEFSGLGMVSVLTVDAADPRPGPAATVVGAGELVYASARNLYVTSTRWTEPVPVPGTGGEATDLAAGQWVPATTTEIHAFDIGDKVTTAYRAS